MSRKIRVVLSAIIYPFTMAHFFWRAFERREDVELYVIGPFTGTWIPWNYGMDIPQKYVKTPNLPLPRQAINNNRLSSEFIRSLMAEDWQEPPDLWVQVDAGWHLSDRPKANCVVHIQTDPHVLKAQYALPKSYSDLNYCMQHCYMEQGELFLPYACDPTIHYPMDIPKEYDACMVGLHYPQRDQLINRLLSRQLTVHYSMGEIYDEYRIAYNKARVALSWSSLNDTPARVYEAFGMDLPLVCNCTPDLSNFFVEGEHYLGFSNVQEAEKQVLLLLSDDAMRDEMANNAYRKVMAGHTYDLRIAQILDNAKLI